MSSPGYWTIGISYIASGGTLDTTTGDTVLSYAPIGSTGPTGPAGGSSFAYTFNTSTAGGDPTSGYLALNNATYSSVSTIYVSNDDAAGTNVSSWLSHFAPGSLLTIFDNSNAANFLTCSIISTSQTTGTPGYWTISVSYIASGGTLDTVTGDTVLSYTPAQSLAALGGLPVVQNVVALGTSGTVTLTTPNNTTPDTVQTIAQSGALTLANWTSPAAGQSCHLRIVANGSSITFPTTATRWLGLGSTSGAGSAPSITAAGTYDFFIKTWDGTNYDWMFLGRFA